MAAMRAHDHVHRWRVSVGPWKILLGRRHRTRRTAAEANPTNSGDAAVRPADTTPDNPAAIGKPTGESA
jgi:hypothetical protein